MNINYDVKKCLHCNSDNVVVLGDENRVYGLVSIEANGTEPTVDLNNMLPVIATVCKNCGKVELIHINAKAIDKN